MLASGTDDRPGAGPTTPGAGRTAPSRTAANRLRGDLLLYTGSAAFAMLTAATSGLVPHRLWGRIAMLEYAAAAVFVIAQLAFARLAATTPRPATATADGRRPARRLAISQVALERLVGPIGRTGLLVATWVTTALVPLLVEAVQRVGGRSGRAQEEVRVIEAAGERLLTTGTPYLGRTDIAALPVGERLGGYTPYQPGMAVFGVPKALFGAVWWADARVWFAVATVAALVAAAVVLRRGVPQRPALDDALIRAGQMATVLPFCALTLAVGGDDLPVLALCLLAFAFAARDRYGAAGLAVGAAGALKLFAWPIAVILLAVAVTRGRRPACRYALPAFGVPLLALLPAFLVDASAAAENVLRFPFGHGLVTSPARSPLPGRLIASAFPDTGRYLVLGLLVLVGVAAVGWLLRRPPRDAAAAARACALWLTAAFVLLPATRFGYLLYPVAFAFAYPVLTKVVLAQVVLARRASLRRRVPAEPGRESSQPPARAALTANRSHPAGAGRTQGT